MLTRLNFFAFSFFFFIFRLDNKFLFELHPIAFPGCFQTGLASGVDFGQKLLTTVNGDTGTEKIHPGIVPPIVDLLLILHEPEGTSLGFLHHIMGDRNMVNGPQVWGSQ